MTHLSTFDGLLGYATLHPLLTFGPVLIGIAGAVIASRRNGAAQSPRRRP